MLPIFMDPYHGARVNEYPNECITEIIEPANDVRPKRVSTTSIVQDQARISENFRRNYYFDNDNKLRDKNTGRII